MESGVIASLQDELGVHAGAEDWEAVIAVSAELDKLDPTTADPRARSCSVSK